MNCPPVNSRPPGRLIGRLVVLCAVLTCLAAALLYPWRSPRPAALLEVPRAQLTLREGHFYQAGGSVPFTGVVTERYPGGSLKCRSVVANGLLEGLSAGWHTNGQQQIEEYFHAGVSHGHRTKWHENGRKQSEADIVAGKIQGVFRRWHPDGALAEEIPMQDGQPEGLSRAYYPSGYLKAQARLRRGEVVEQRSWREHEQVLASQLQSSASTSAQPISTAP